MAAPHRPTGSTPYLSEVAARHNGLGRQDLAARSAVRRQARKEPRPYSRRVDRPTGRRVHENEKLNSFDMPLLEFWYLRDWKKSKHIPGGFRAKNLQYLTDNLKLEKNTALRKYRNLPNPNFAYGLYNSSLVFYDFCIGNFKNGNYARGKEQLVKYTESVPF